MNQTNTHPAPLTRKPGQIASRVFGWWTGVYAAIAGVSLVFWLLQPIGQPDWSVVPAGAKVSLWLTFNPVWMSAPLILCTTLGAAGFFRRGHGLGFRHLLRVYAVITTAVVFVAIAAHIHLTCLGRIPFDSQSSVSIPLSPSLFAVAATWLVPTIGAWGALGSRSNKG